MEQPRSLLPSLLRCSQKMRKIFRIFEYSTFLNHTPQFLQHSDNFKLLFSSKNVIPFNKNGYIFETKFQQFNIYDQQHYDSSSSPIAPNTVHYLHAQPPPQSPNKRQGSWSYRGVFQCFTLGCRTRNN